MRHICIGDFYTAYEDGRAAVLLADGVAVGFLKLTERPSSKTMANIGVNLSAYGVPKIMELGSAIMLPEFRGRSLYPGLQNRLLQDYKEPLLQGNMLIVGATVTIGYLMSFRQLPEWLGFNVTTIQNFHASTPALSALLCSCDPQDRSRDIIRLRGCPAEAEPSPSNSASMVRLDYTNRTVTAVIDGVEASLMDRRKGQTSSAVLFSLGEYAVSAAENGIRNAIGLFRYNDIGSSFRELLRGNGYYDNQPSAYA
jgi:hypothetical protein